MHGDSTELKKMKFLLRKKLQIKQGIERIYYERDIVQKMAAEFLGKAQLPEAPAIRVMDIDWGDLSDPLNDNDKDKAE